MNTGLSPTQIACIEHMEAHPFPLKRLPGGFWTTTDCQPPTDKAFPEKWWGTPTVRVLLRKGVIYNETETPFWNGSYRLKKS
jgi:hypothetical protein